MTIFDPMMGTRPAGITALSFFFVFGTTMSGLAALMLLFPRSALASLWRLNPAAGVQLGGLGAWGMLLMLTVSAACAIAATGLWRLKTWGYWTALAILIANLLGDTANAALFHDWRTLIGLPIGGAMVFYLARQRTRFASEPA
jgi:hypothetical protein